jgi:hypothetical protein
MRARVCPTGALVAGLSAALVVGALLAGPAHAQQAQATVAKLKDVQGNVLVSQGDAMVAGAADQRLSLGTRVVTTAGGKATISYDVGCDVTLPPNSRFTVRVGECALLAKEVVALGPAEGAIGGGAGTVAAGGAAAGGDVQLFMGVVGATALGYGAYETFRKTTVSPN